MEKSKRLNLTIETHLLDTLKRRAVQMKMRSVGSLAVAMIRVVLQGLDDIEQRVESDEEYVARMFADCEAYEPRPDGDYVPKRRKS